MTRHIAPTIARATRPGISDELRPVKRSEDGWKESEMALPGSELEFDMKAYDKWRKVMEAGLLDPVFSEPLPLTPAGEFIRVRKPSDFKIVNKIILASPPPPPLATPKPRPAKPLGGDGFNIDHAWDMIVLAARASRYE